MWYRKNSLVPVLGAILLSLGGFVSASAQGLAVELKASPDFLFFRQSASASPAPQQVSLALTSSAAFSFTIQTSTQSGGNWLVVYPMSGSGLSRLTVSVNRGIYLPAYTGAAFSSRRLRPDW